MAGEGVAAGGTHPDTQMLTVGHDDPGDHRLFVVCRMAGHRRRSGGPKGLQASVKVSLDGPITLARKSASPL
jgi:hypothetical protein